jgi:hypothetical protein
MTRGEQIGVVVGGSLTKSLEVRLDAGKAAQLGQYVMTPLDGGAQLLGMVTDVVLQSAESGATSWPPPAGDNAESALIREVLLDTGVYTRVDVNPYLEVSDVGGETARARRIPRHFAAVALADQDAFSRAFDVVDERAAIRLGSPLGMDTVEVAVDAEKLFERSCGVFGKSGTGKSVTVLQVLDAMVTDSAARATNREKTVALVFDMHGDYGEYMKFEGGQRRSLKGMHPNDVDLCSVEDSAAADYRVLIGTRDITPDDLAVLQSSTGLTDAAIEAAAVLHERLGREWFDAVLADEPPAKLLRRVDADSDEAPTWADVQKSLDIHPGSFANLRRNLRAIVRMDFVRPGADQVSDAIAHIVQMLQGGRSVVVQFGSRHGRDLMSYMLVANMLSRRIWEAYQRRMDDARGESAKEPNRLVIVIEEAHKFIDRTLAGQSIFGQIARELRKYNVTLLIIDQRPSQIDTEVLSQIGTRFCLQLDSEADVEALVGGVSGRAGLKAVIASLESKQQALVFGHALPMPVVVRPPDLTSDYKPGSSLRARLGAVARGPATPAGLYGPRT